MIGLLAGFLIGRWTAPAREAAVAPPPSPRLHDKVDMLKVIGFGLMYGLAMYSVWTFVRGVEDAGVWLYATGWMSYLGETALELATLAAIVVVVRRRLDKSATMVMVRKED